MRQDFLLRVRMTPDLAAMIDRQAARTSRTRSAEVRSILEAALAPAGAANPSSTAEGSPRA